MASDPLFPSGNDPERPTGASNEPVVPTPLSTGGPGVEPSGFASPTTSPVTDSGLTPNVAAGLAVLMTLITGLIFLFLEKRNRFVRYWAMQAVFFGAAVLVYSIVSAVIGSVLGHIFWLLAILWGLFSLLISLGFLVVWVIMLVQAFSGKEWEVPFVGKLARQQLAKMPVG